MRRDRHGGDLVGQRGGGGRAVDDAPGHERAVLRLARPFEVGDGDAAERAGGDGADEVGVAERREVAVALDGELGQVHRARGVDGQHDLGVDLDRPPARAVRLAGRRSAARRARERSTEHARASSAPLVAGEA